MIEIVRERGPLTVAAFMELALYDPAAGYYARLHRRSGRTGDFFTSVDVGPLFGRLLAVQIAQMAGLLGSRPFDLVEAGASDGRLAADILTALAANDPDLYSRTRLHLVEASAAARAAQPVTLGPMAERLADSSDGLPDSFEGVLVANELLDAFPVHQVVARGGTLREVYVHAMDGRLATTEGPLSTPALGEYLDACGATLQDGWRAEVNLRAVEWIGDAATRLRRGFLILIDYGHLAHELYSATHANGTLTSFSRHAAADSRDGPAAAWLERPGEQDITSHVDFTSVSRAAADAGLMRLALVDQTYFLFGLAGLTQAGGVSPSISTLTAAERRAFMTLSMPGGLGSTMKVLVLAKGMGEPVLAGCAFGTRLT